MSKRKRYSILVAAIIANIGLYGFSASHALADIPSKWLWCPGLDCVDNCCYVYVSSCDTCKD